MDAEVREAVSGMFGADVGKGPDFPRVSASSSWRGGGYDAALAADGDPRTRWNAADGTRGDEWLEVDFGAAKTFGRTVVREAFDRTRAYRIGYWDGAKWIDCIKGGRLGPRKADTCGPVTASKVRLCIDAIASDSATIFEFEVYDREGRNIARPRGAYRVHANARGGKAYFLPSPRAGALKAVLDDALAVWDVEFEDDVIVRGGNLSYIHKVVGGRHVYFFGNSSDTPVDTHVRLRGKLRPGVWDPHTGRIARGEYTLLAESGRTLTRVRLRLAPVRSVFLVADALPASE